MVSQPFLRGLLREVSGVYQGSLRGVSVVFQVYSKGLLSVSKGWSMAVYFDIDTRIRLGCFNGVSKSGSKIF